MNRCRSITKLMLLSLMIAAGVAPVTAAETTDRGPAKAWADDDSLYDAPGRTVFGLRGAVAGDPAFASRVGSEEALARAQFAELSRRLAQATAAEAPSLAREVETAKREHEARLIELRLRRARALGKERSASTLERRLRDLRAGVKGGR